MGGAEGERELGGRIDGAATAAAQLLEQTDLRLNVLDLRLEPGPPRAGTGGDLLGRLLFVLVETDAVLELANPILESRVAFKGLPGLLVQRSLPGRPAGQVGPDRIVVAFERH